MTNGNLGPVQPDLDNDTVKRQFVAWKYNTQFPFISLELQSITPVTALDLYVLNYSEENISLPMFELFHTPSPTTVNSTIRGEIIPFQILNNDQLSGADSNFIKITLRPLSSFANQGVLLTWTFTGLYNVDWFILSEIRMCKDTQPPLVFTPVNQFQFQIPSENQTIIQPSADILASGSLVLTCTLSLQGSFIWRWRKGTVIIQNSTKTSVLSADGTRTSILTINQLNFNDANLYMCETSYSGQNDYGSREYNVQFPSKSLNVSDIIIIYPFVAIVDVAPSTMGFLGDGSVMLTCEVYGYTELEVSNLITWTSDNGANFSDPSKYTITVTDGSRELIYPDGSTEQSIVSKLAIFQLSLEDEGNYTCNIGNIQSTTQLLIMGGTSPITTPIPIVTTTNSTRNQGI